MAYVDFSKTHKRTYAAVASVELAALSGLTKKERLLIQLRSSYVNGCNYCINMHERDAEREGFDRAWTESIRNWQSGAGLGFSEEENLILGFATQGTKLGDSYDSDFQEKVLDHFGEKKFGALVSAIIAINAWNRIGVLTEK